MPTSATARQRPTSWLCNDGFQEASVAFSVTAMGRVAADQRAWADVYFRLTATTQIRTSSGLWPFPEAVACSSHPEPFKSRASDDQRPSVARH